MQQRTNVPGSANRPISRGCARIHFTSALSVGSKRNFLLNFEYQIAAVTSLLDMTGKFVEYKAASCQSPWRQTEEPSPHNVGVEKNEYSVRNHRTCCQLSARESLEYV